MRKNEENKKSGSERRIESRLDSLNFVSYSYLDKENNIQIEDIGRTLDISSGGIKMEVPSYKIPALDMELYIALEECVLKVKGEIAHLERHDNGCCEIGVRFMEMSAENKKTLEKFLKQHKK